MEATEHEFSEDWTAADVTNHYHGCVHVGCRATDGAEAHDYSGGDCVCGLTMLTENDVEIEVKGVPCVYTGDRQKPNVIITAFDHLILQMCIDYDLAYENNVNVGTAKVIIIFTGDYAGTLERTFEIIEDPNAGSFDGEWV